MTPLILVTNDDGIESPGLHAVVSTVAAFGTVLIVAPVVQQTSMSRAWPVGAMIGMIETRYLAVDDQRYPAYAVHGSPAQAVLHAVLELAERKPDLCISGINYGENLGASITRSGTIGAALEASSFGIPSMAIAAEVKLEQQHASSYAPINWETAALVTQRMVVHVLQQGFPAHAALLNINVPRTATAQTALRVTTQSKQNYYEERPPMRREWTPPYRFTSHICVDLETLEPESDIYAFTVDRVVSITPLGLNLTADQAVKRWQWG